MDELILKFSPHQHKKYLEICERVKTEKIEIEFDRTLLPPSQEEPLCDITPYINDLSNRVNAVLAIKDSSFAWWAENRNAENDKLIISFMAVMKKASEVSLSLLSVQARLSAELEAYESSHIRLETAYAEFLPFKAALVSHPEYSSKISDIEGAFKVAHELYGIYIKARADLLIRIEILCSGIIEDFLSKCNRFENFENYSYYNDEFIYKYCRELLEQLKHA